MNTEIQCPNCQETIILEVSMLLEGKSFSCSNPHCDASIAIGSESVSIVASAFNEFDKLKQQGIK